MADISVRECQSVTQFIPLTTTGQTWIADHLLSKEPDNLMWFGQYVALPWRDAMDVLNQIERDHVTVELS